MVYDLSFHTLQEIFTTNANFSIEFRGWASFVVAAAFIGCVGITCYAIGARR